MPRGRQPLPHQEGNVDIDAEPGDASQHAQASSPFDAQPGPRAQLTAIVEVLSVLARSSSSQEEVFDAVLGNARRLCGADVAQIHLLSQRFLRLGRALGVKPEYVALSEANPTRVDRQSLVGRVTCPWAKVGSNEPSGVYRARRVSGAPSS